MTPRTFQRYLAAACFATVSVSSLAQGGGNASAVVAAPNAEASSAAPTTANDARSDRALAVRVRHALRAARKQGLKSTFIRVRAHDGAITLSGVVASDTQIALAIAVAQGVNGVRAVTSKIEVRGNTGITGSQ
ncbi:BON domain-containing protein [Paraburkholderia sp. J63]|uniref:BON domain-containing protein n=1 Tax=Paraburkholderia sp. J63 TaxID=2805434 RepID=UPI002ABE7799|nr:BON domain-containing protein [Paraburkholderia sp. J63]